MTTETVTLYVERKLSDGSFGSQGFSLGVTLTVDDTEDFVAVIERQYAALLATVLERLAASPNGHVASTARHELHAEEEVQQRAEAWALSNAVAEERAIRHMDDDVNLEDLPF